MLPTTPQETKRQLRKGPAVGAIQICLDGRKAAYLSVAIGRGLVPNWYRIWQNGKSHIAHFFIPSYTDPSQKNLIWIAGTQPVTKPTRFFIRGAAAPKYAVNLERAQQRLAEHE